MKTKPIADAPRLMPAARPASKGVTSVQQGGVRAEDGVDGKGQGAVLPFDPIAHLTPAPYAGEAQAKSKLELPPMVAKISDPAARGVLEAGLLAQERVDKMASVEAPGRLAVRGGGRPAEIVGWVERAVGGTPDAPRSKPRLNPKDKSTGAVALTNEVIEGLRSGAMVKLELEETIEGEQIYRVRAEESEYATSFLATVVVEDGKAFAVGLPEQPVFRRVPLVDQDAAAHAGERVLVDVDRPYSRYRAGKIHEVLGQPGDHKARFMRVAVSEGASLGTSLAAQLELKQILAMELTGTNLRHLPFITIDNDNSMDLDQALCFQRRPDGGFDLHYAIADVNYFVRHGGAIDREAKRRAETLYFGGRNEPMYPRELSEGRISLLPNEDKRAFVATLSYDKNGEQIGQSFQRGLIQSRAKLSYRGVQKYFDLPEADRKNHAFAGQGYLDSLLMLKEFGERQILAAEARGVVQNRAREVELRPGPGESVQIAGEDRLPVELWNEQVSLAVNQAVGHELHLAGLKTLYRVHPSPAPERILAFRGWVSALGHPWPEEQSLAGYLKGLDPADPTTKLIAAQAIHCNSPAHYETEPLGHSGLNLPEYTHFTAPMRRYVDVVVAGILAAHVEGKKAPYQAEGDPLLQQVAALAKSAKQRASNVEHRVDRVLAAELWSSRLGKPLPGTVAQVRPSGLVIQLDEGLSVDVSAGTLKNLTGDTAAPALLASGTVLAAGGVEYKVGDRLDVVALSADPERETLELAPYPLAKAAGKLPAEA